MSAVHVVFGAGQVGPKVAAALVQEGRQVRVVRRSTAAVGDGIEVVTGDVRDPAFALRAAGGAAVLYHCLNPSRYSSTAWESEFPVFGDALVSAAVARGARLVVLENLYCYGPVDGARTEDTPLLGKGRKARVRIAWDHRLRREASERGLRWVMGRAGDYFGPGTADQSLVGTDAVRHLAAGRPVLLVGDPDAPHAFSYVPDVAAGLVRLGAAGPEVEGRVFHLPVHVIPPRALVTTYAVHLGVPVRIRRLPGWSVHALSLFVPILRELRETLYQWDRPFLVDDRRFRAAFAGVGCDVDEAIAAHVAEMRRETSTSPNTRT